MTTLDIHGDRLTLEEVERVAGEDAPRLRLSERAARAVSAAREVVDAAIREGRVVYGLTTGFGALAEVVIPPDRIEELQENLIRSHAAGVGEPLPEPEVRAIMVLRANVLALGHSGVRVEVVERLLEMLNRRVHPVVPSRGSVGASGDLAPLSHLALVLIGASVSWAWGSLYSRGAALPSSPMMATALQMASGGALEAHPGARALSLRAAL